MDRTSKPNFAVNPCNNSALRKASRNLGVLFDETFAPSGLRAGQFGILVHVDMMGAPTMKALAAALVMDVSALGHTLKPLMRDGYVDLRADTRDRRSKRVVLTPAGFDKMEEACALWQDAQGRVESVLGADKAKALREALATMADETFSAAYRAVGTA